MYGGLETCPTTGKVHYQAHVACRAQARWSTIKKWLPGARIVVSNAPAESIAYCLKLDTAAATKKITENPNAYMTDRKAMELLVETCGSLCECTFFQPGKGKSECHLDEKEDYWHRVRAILMTDPHLCGLFAKPDLYRLWKNTKSVWVARKRAEQERSKGIVLPLATQTSQIIFSLENTNASTAPPLQEEARSQSSGEEEGDESSTCTESDT